MVLKALLLDLDGVITDTAEYHYQAWKTLAASIGIQIDREFNENLKGMSRMDSLDIILKSADRHNDFSISEKEKLAEQKNEDYKQSIVSITPKEIYPGIERLLDDARDADLKLILCSASKNAPTILEQLQLTDHFDAVVNPGQLKNSKPDPEMFLTGAGLAGVLPKECIGIEDAASGVQSIKASDGMLAVGVGDPETLAEADIIVEDTRALNIEFLQEIYNRYID